MKPSLVAGILGCLLIGTGYFKAVATSALCVFPFIYQGVTYNKCTIAGWGEKEVKKPWCSLTWNYDKDPRWKLCDEKENAMATPGPCVFPFIYQGVTYNKCTIVGWGEKEEKRPWCSLTCNYDTDPRWRLCDEKENAVTTLAPCVFPFIYQGVTYNKCTIVGWGEKEVKRLWCSLSRNYDTDPRWRLCNEKENAMATPASCVFPFIYQGVTYNKCTIVGWGEKEEKRPWCSLTRNYDTDPRWKLCDEEVNGENVASKGQATQSSLFSNKVYRLGLPKNAIDGNKDPNYHHGSCTHTERDYSPWWSVDLNNEHKIHSIAVTGRIEAPERLNGAEIRVGNSLENNGNNNPRCGVISGIGPGQTQTFQCNGMVGRYVNVVLPGKQEWLTLCEVEVLGELIHDDPMG